MLNVSRDSFVETSDTGGLAAPARHLKPWTALSNLRRHIKGSVALVLLFLGLGLGYALTSTPLYTASTDILVDARRSHAGEAGAANRSLAELGMDPASIDSQVSVLGSEQVATTALKAMHLERDGEFAAPTTLPGVLLQNLKHALGRSSPEAGEDGVSADILEGFMKSLDVKRIQQTYVLSLSFSARSAERASAIANMLANVYVNGQVQAALDSRKRTDTWLKDRVAAVRSEVAAGEQAVRSLKAELGSGLLATGTEADGSGRERLRALERSLDDERLLYAALIDRANAALQQQSMPISDASVLRSARPPQRKSAPNTPIVLVLSAVAGLASALGLATWRELADKTFRVPSQFETELEIRFLGVMPRVRVPRGERRQLLRGNWTKREAPEAGSRRRPSISDEIRTRFTTPLRALKLAVDGGVLHDRLAVLGVTSAVAGEGRSTVAINLAGVIARSGRRTLVIDADLRHPDLSRVCAPERQAGLVDVLGGNVSLEAAVVHDDVAGVDILAAWASGTDRAAMLGLSELESVLERARERYDAVVLDLPPLAALTEVTAISSAIGAFVLVVRWGRTERAVVAEALRSTPAVSNRLVGAVFNVVDFGRLRRLAQDPRDVFYLTGAKRPRAA